MRDCIRTFLTDERGGVPADYVFLLAGVIGMMIAIVSSMVL
ncbi:MAG: hypothetical protein QNJ35_06070 [Paracoccaceae bacterium]|nr:hypothetical protein [Paracoccaceae bacterium]